MSNNLQVCIEGGFFNSLNASDTHQAEINNDIFLESKSTCICTFTFFIESFKMRVGFVSFQILLIRFFVSSKYIFCSSSSNSVSHLLSRKITSSWSKLTISSSDSFTFSRIGMNWNLFLLLSLGAAKIIKHAQLQRTYHTWK